MISEYLTTSIEIRPKGSAGEVYCNLASVLPPRGVEVQQHVGGRRQEVGVDRGGRTALPRRGAEALRREAFHLERPYSPIYSLLFPEILGKTVTAVTTATGLLALALNYLILKHISYPRPVTPPA